MRLFRYKTVAAILYTAWSFLALCTSAVVMAQTSQGTAENGILAISMDNDFFVPLMASDRDFTGGMALTYSSDSGRVYWHGPDQLLNAFDAFATGKESALISRSIEIGFYGFTPNDVAQAEVVENDRPYASLAYISMSRLYEVNRDAISTSLTLGVLGSDIVGDTQSAIHNVLGNKQARGWHNQISDGGEITARYQIAYHDYWDSNTFSSRVKTTWFSSVGYLTEAGVALSTRRGLISSPDHRFNPELISYGERVNEIAVTPYRGTEHYFWGGVALKARFYNAFLQGQFRHSNHSLNSDDLRPVIVEAWLGYTVTIGRSYKASYIIRGQTSEIVHGEGDRGHVWGGVVLSRSL